MGKNRIKEWRKKRGLTQTELGARVNATRGQIYNLETGLRGLSEKWLKKLARALECDVVDLIADGAILEDIPSINTTKDMKEKKKLRNFFDKISSYHEQFGKYPTEELLLWLYKESVGEVIKKTE